MWWELDYDTPVFVIDNKLFHNDSKCNERNFYWWWVVIKITLDDEWGGELFKIFDWDGNELEEQPRKQ